MNRFPSALAIIGPTASGKTAFALSLAQKIPLEIISMDSALVYREMDIGTAKPSLLEQQHTPHHLIDLISPIERYSAADFVRDTARCIHEIRGRGKLPVIVGGTLLYFCALRDGLNDLPTGNENTREEIKLIKKEKGLMGLYQLLQKIDPQTAHRLKANDTQRIERAVEIYLISQKPMSAWLSESCKRSPFNLPALGLLPDPREKLHQNIQQRFNQMIDQGLLDEVIALKNNYPILNQDFPSMRCVGYRQVYAHLAGQMSHTEMIEKGIIATRQLAKRQWTWLRKISLEISINPYQNYEIPYSLLELAKKLSPS